MSPTTSSRPRVCPDPAEIDCRYLALAAVCGGIVCGGLWLLWKELHG